MKNIFRIITLLMLLVAGPKLAFSQTTTSNDTGMMLVFYLIIGLVAVLILVLALFVALLGVFFAKELKSKGEEVPGILKLFLIFEGDTTALTGEYKDEVMDNHDYDGIQELDNDLPPWWKWMFYITIVFGVFYIFHYHVLGTGKLQEAEYQAEVARAEILYANVDKTYEAAETDEAILAPAKDLFVSNCAACHKPDGGGSVGPNLTDAYWLHGGSINDLVKTIKHGVPDKGMKSWKQDFSSEEIYHIASFILSLQGTNPTGGKAPQGELYESEK